MIRLGHIVGDREGRGISEVAPARLDLLLDLGRDGRTGRMIRQYVAYARRCGTVRVNVVGDASDLRCREAVSEAVMELTGAVPE